MLKKMTALLLALCMALSLAACGKKEQQTQGEASSAPVVEKEYASKKALDVFETLEAVRDLKDYTFTLQINTVDKLTGDAAQNLLLLSGSSYESVKQSVIHAVMGEDTLTTVYIDGSDVIMDAKTAANCLADKFVDLQRMSSSDKYEFSDALKEVAEELPEQYVVFHLEEDLWASKESGTLSASVTEARNDYEAVKHAVSGKVKQGEESCSLMISAGDLQRELKKLTGSIIDKKDVFKDGIVSTLERGFSDVLVSYGMDAENLFETKWEKTTRLDEFLQEMENAGIWNNWSVKVLTSGEKEEGYSIDLTDIRENPRNYFINAFPAKPETVEELPDCVEASDYADPLAELYSYSEIYREALKEEPVIVDETKEEDYQDGESSGAPSGVGLDIHGLTVEPMTDYKNIGSTVVYTEDGYPAVVPVPLNYDNVEAERTDDMVVDVFLSSNGYAFEYSGVTDRDPKEQVQDNIDIYKETFAEEYGYVVSQTGKLVTNADGTAAFSGITYYDEERRQDVTILTGTIAVPESEYGIGLDIFVYSRSVTGQDIASFNELLSAFGVDSPLTIVKN